MIWIMIQNDMHDFIYQITYIYYGVYSKFSMISTESIFVVAYTLSVNTYT